jgi:predicted site-specific integrase-resolvase
VSDTRLSQQQLAERWGLSPKTLERWRVQGIGPVYIRLPGRVVYRLEDVEAYERDSLRQGTAERASIGGAA